MSSLCRSNAFIEISRHDAQNGSRSEGELYAAQTIVRTLVGHHTLGRAIEGHDEIRKIRFGSWISFESRSCKECP